MVDLTVHDVAHVSDHWICGTDRPQQLQRGQQRRERIAKLVPQRGQELVFPLIGEAQRVFRPGPLGQMLPNLVLPFPCPDGGPHRADKRRHPHGPLEKRHVAQRPHRFHGLRRVGAAARENQHRQIGPRRLRGEHGGQRGVVVVRRSFLGQQQRSGPRFHLVEHRLERPARVDANPQRRQHRLGHLCVLGGRGEKHQPVIA